jgi:RNA polymerase sigma factor (sigma-70 family)
MSVFVEGRDVPRTAASTFGEFYRREWPDVAGFCAALAGSESVGDDLAQEAFTQVCTRWALIREPRPYVFRIARNLAYRQHRHAAREVLVDAPPDGARSTDDLYGVMDAVRALPDRLRDVVLLHYYADLPVADVAKSLRRPLGSVKRQLSEARVLLSHSLGDDRA